MRHAGRVSTHTTSPERDHLERSGQIHPSISAHRPLGSSQNLPLFAESFPGAHHPPFGHDDEFAPPGFGGLDHGPQTMGDAPGGLRPGPRAHVHPDLHHAAPVVFAVAAADGDCHFVLPDLGRDYLHVEQQGYRRGHGPI